MRLLRTVGLHRSHRPSARCCGFPRSSYDLAAGRGIGLPAATAANGSPPAADDTGDGPERAPGERDDVQGRRERDDEGRPSARCASRPRVRGSMSSRRLRMLSPRAEILAAVGSLRRPNCPAPPFGECSLPRRSDAMTIRPVEIPCPHALPPPIVCDGRARARLRARRRHGCLCCAGRTRDERRAEDGPAAALGNRRGGYQDGTDAALAARGVDVVLLELRWAEAEPVDGRWNEPVLQSVRATSGRALRREADRAQLRPGRCTGRAARRGRQPASSTSTAASSRATERRTWSSRRPCGPTPSAM